MNLYVNFDDINDDKQINDNLEHDHLYDKEYDTQTIDWYKNMREKKYNIFTHDALNFNENEAFKFSQMWDPFTGERLGDDPHGPLCFHPDDLIRFFYKRRLKMLWNEAKNDENGGYQGYYGEAVGSGENIEIKGSGIKGICPELYLFRLPIDDCYLLPNCNKSIINISPKLNDKDIAQIDFLANTYHNLYYKKTFNKERPSLTTMKKLYDQAISKNPDISMYVKNKKISSFTSDQIDEFKNKANRDAVEKLKLM
jgi:hypothetical protein